MFSSRDIGAWLDANGITAPIEYDGEPLSTLMEDQVVVVSRSPGAKSQFERAFDVAGFQVVTRGNQDDSASGEALAGQVDDLLLDTVCPVAIGDRRVIVIDRTGGPPTLVDRDTARRTVFACNYLFTVARS